MSNIENTNLPDEEAGFWRTNRGVGIGLTAGLLALLAYLASSEWVYQELRDGFHLGSMPVAGVIAMLVCTFVLIFDGYRHEVPQRLAGVTPRDWVNAALMLGGCWLLFFVAQQTSMLIAAPLFLAIFIYILGVRPWTTSVIAAIAMGGIVYVVFRLLGIELPHGALAF